MRILESSSYVITGSLIYYIFILMIIILIVVIFVYSKLKNNIKDVNKTNKKAQENLQDIDEQINNIKNDNKEIVKLHKQINDKSEAMSKILEQTTKIYQEVLEKDFEVEADYPAIDYNELNSKREKPGRHLSELIETINENNTTTKRSKRLNFNSLTAEELNYLSLDELDELKNQLDQYEVVLKKEFQAYVKEIKGLNDLDITPSNRLAQKERMYKKMQEIEKKLAHQENLINSIKETKENKLIDIETKNKENQLDELINNMTNKKI